MPAPEYIADYYYTKVTGLSNTYVDYYVSATDNQGNTYNSPIQHVYVSPTPTNVLAAAGEDPAVSAVSASRRRPLWRAIRSTITYSAAGGPIASASQVYIHLGWNNWATVVSPDAAMTFNSASNTWVYTTTVPSTATQLDCDANNGAGTWDNNSGQDYKFAVTSGGPPQLPPTPTNVTASATSSTGIAVNWSSTSNTVGYVVYRGSNQVGNTTLTTFNDGNLLPNTQYCYTIASSNSAGLSAQSSQACATTFTNSSPNPPPTPTNVTATAIATNQINVTWSSSAGATSYIVARGGNPIATVSASPYLDTGLSANSQYCYTIAASNAVSASAFSSSACATTFAGPYRPSF